MCKKDNCQLLPVHFRASPKFNINVGTFFNCLDEDGRAHHLAAARGLTWGFHGGHGVISHTPAFYDFG